MSGDLDFVIKGHLDSVINIGIGVFLIFLSYKGASLAKAKGKPVSFLKLWIL